MVLKHPFYKRPTFGPTPILHSLTLSPSHHPPNSSASVSSTPKKHGIVTSIHTELPKPPQPQAPNLYSRPMGSRCYLRGQPGHRSNECPQHRHVHLADDVIHEALFGIHKTKVLFLNLTL
ncbi:hypothetical protein Scep_004799 [Stephania cephalantha]|uniref:CCHC-type domain-containing protein n=1 Tax=Stephania cephalantha TaxID=152367 RepID=A0AAP0KU10_9MAGN